MTDYLIEAKTPGRDWRTLGRHRDDLTRRDYDMSAAELTRDVIDRLTAEYPENEYRAVPVPSVHAAVS